jgi:hypothetical protein
MRNRYIELLASKSVTEHDELVLECMDYYGVNSTSELSDLQLHRFCRIVGII